jgi:site-specific DNA-methyltransferase (adenine-specific)
VKPYYDEDGITIYHGDCLDVLPTLGRDMADAVVTDPPFYMPAQQYSGRNDSVSRSWADTSILSTWFSAVAEALTAVVKDAGHVLVFCDDASYPVFYPPLYTRWPNLACLVWDKQRPGMGTAWRMSSELIIAARGRSAYWTGGAQGSVLHAKPVASAERLHPVDKPVDLLRQLIEVTTPPGGLVVDAFAGGGSTLVAAKKLGCRAIGIELDERYCEIAVQRLAQGVLEFT